MPTGTRPPIPPNHAKCVISGTIYGRAFHNVCYLEIAGSGITSTDLDTLAGSIWTALVANLAPLVNSQVTFASVTLTYVPSVGVELVGIHTGAQAGTRAGTAIDSAAICLLVSWRIPAYYRGGHPRWYLPGLNSDDVAGGSTVGTTLRSLVATNAATFRAAVNGMTTSNITAVTIGTLSFIRANAWRVPPVFYPFGSVSSPQHVGNQRRRIYS